MEMKFRMPLRYTPGRFVFEFHQDRMSEPLLRHLSFLQPKVNYSNSIELTNFILDANIHQHTICLIRVKETLTDAEGH